MVKLDVELPAHPSPLDLAEATIDLDEARARLRAATDSGVASELRTLERALEAVTPLLHATYALAVTSERVRVAESRGSASGRRPAVRRCEGRP